MINKREGDDKIGWQGFNFFQDSLFPFDLKKARMDEFINLKQGGMSLREYAFKFTKFSKYSPTLVSDLVLEYTSLFQRFLTC